MKKLIFYEKVIFPLILILLIINMCSFFMVNNARKAAISASYLKVVSNYIEDSHNYGDQWNDIAIEFDRSIKFGKNRNAIKLFVDNKAVPISVRINNRILYVHPMEAYIYNKKYSVKIPGSSIIGTSKSVKTTEKVISFNTHNISDYNSLGLTDFMASAKEFYDFMINNYPFLNMTKTVTGFDFQKNKNYIINILALSKDENDFNSNLAKILNKLIPGTHTKPTNLAVYAPSEFMYIYLSGEYVVVSSSNPDIHIGDIVTKINGQNIDNYIAEGNNAIISNLDMYRKKLYANASTFLSNKDLTFTIKDFNNGEKTFSENLKKIDSGAYVYLQPAKANTSDITSSIIEKDNIAYLKVPTFTVMNIKKLDDFISSVKDYKYLIVDVRNNNGGDLGYSKELISRLIDTSDTVTNYIFVKNNSIQNNKYKQAFNFYDDTEALSSVDKKSLEGIPYYLKTDDYNVYKVEINLNPAAVHFNGKVYVLTNNSCFSACEHFCNTLKRINGATLVGGYTGGDGILFIPDAKAFLYDKIKISYSYSIGMEEDGTINQLNHTKPDYFVEQDKDDYINYLTQKGDFTLYDTVLNKCLSLIDEDRQ